jgi:hypothetical protein
MECAEIRATGFVYAPALGVIGYAAAPRGGLGPLPPPLCRYANHPKRQGSELQWHTTVEFLPPCLYLPLLVRIA